VQQLIPSDTLTCRSVSIRLRWLTALGLGLPSPAPAQANALRIVLDSVVAPRAEFAAIAEGVALDSSAVLIRDSRLNEVTLLSAGEPAPRTLSRHGSGPGEFRVAIAFGVIGDSIWVAGSASFPVNEIIRFPIRGGVGTTTIPIITAANRPGQSITIAGCLAGGLVLARRAFDSFKQLDSATSEVGVLVGTPAGQWTEAADLEASGPRNVILHDRATSNHPRTEYYANPLRPSGNPPRRYRVRHRS